jgi:hypothetical protein
MFSIVIHFVNGSIDHSLPISSYQDALDICTDQISYSGGRVKRVEIHEAGGSIYAMWDITWSAESKRAGLRIMDRRAFA